MERNSAITMRHDWYPPYRPQRLLSFRSVLSLLRSRPCRDGESNDAGIKLLASEPPFSLFVSTSRLGDLHMQIARYK